MGVGMDTFGSPASSATRRSIDAPTARRFAKDEGGATALEFGLILVPFAMLVFAIIETSIVFFTGQALQTAVFDASRLILTGQVQKAKVPDGMGGEKNYDLGSFRAEICGRFPVIKNCASSLMLDVKTAASWGGQPETGIGADKKVDPAKWGSNWQPGNAGEIVIVRAAFEHPMAMRFSQSYLGTFMKFDLSNLSNGHRFIMATAAFRNEPFPN